MSDIKKLLEDFSRIESTSSKNSETLTEFGFLSKLQKSLEKRSPYQPPKQQDTTSWQPNQEQLAWLNKGGATNVDRFDPAIIARMPAKLGDKPPLEYYKPEDQKYAQQTAFIPQAIKNLTTPVDLNAPVKTAAEREENKRALQRIIQSQPQQYPTGMEPSLEENGLQAYLGNKKYGKEGMDALRKAGRDGASKEKMAKIRAKYDKLDEEGVAEGAGEQKYIAVYNKHIGNPSYIGKPITSGGKVIYVTASSKEEASSKFVEIFNRSQVLSSFIGKFVVVPKDACIYFFVSTGHLFLASLS